MHNDPVLLKFMQHIWCCIYLVYLLIPLRTLWLHSFQKRTCLLVFLYIYSIFGVLILGMGCWTQVWIWVSNLSRFQI